MLEYELLRNEGILIVAPKAPLKVEDFKELNRKVDPYIAEMGKLKGLMIYTSTFPGWETFEAFLAHIKFIKNHHQKTDKVAVATDSKLLAILTHIASHFVQAEIRFFSCQDKETARDWLKSKGTNIQDVTKGE